MSLFTFEDVHNVHKVPKTQTLILEDKYDYENSLFTMAEADIETDTGRKIVSLKRLYLLHKDPTEYKFAMEVFGSWKYWGKLKEAALMKKHLPQWKIELETLLKSEALEKVVKIAADVRKPNTAYQASKFLLKEYFPEPKKASNRGRPSKEEVAGELAKEARISKELKEHMARVGLTRVK